MTSITSLADALFKTSSGIGTLLSQMDAAAQTAGQNDLFSNLLSQDSGLQASLQQISSVAQQATQSTASGDTSSGSLLQNLGNLSSALHQTLDNLRQQNNGNNSSQNQTTPDDSAAVQTQQAQGSGAQNTASVSTGFKSGTVFAKNQSGGSNGFGTKAAATTTTSSASAASATVSTATPPKTSTPADVGGADAAPVADTSSGDQKTLQDIIAELLMLTQMVIRNVQQAEGTTTMPATTATDTTTAATTAAAGAASANAALASAATTALLALPATGTVAVTGTTADPSSATPAPVDAAFTDLLNLLQKTAQSLGDDSATAAASATAKLAGTAADLTTLAALSDPAGRLGMLNDALKNALASLRQSNAAQTQTTAATARQSDAVAAATDRPAAPAGAATDTAQTADTPGWQSQLFGALGGAAASPQATSSGHAFANAAALTGAAEKNSGASFGDGSNDAGGDGAAASFANTSAAASTLSAEGAQASGTYSFASQLSALRAANGGAIGLPGVVDQVILQMNRNVKNGQDQMSLQLQPGDLGKITVKLDFGSDGKVQGTVVADNPKTLDLLQKDSRSLERALQDAGLRADSGSLQFSLGGQGQNAQSGQAGGKSGGSDSAAADGTISAQDGLGLIDLGALAETYYVTPGGVNIRV